MSPPPIALYFIGRGEWNAITPTVNIPRMDQPAKYVFCAMQTETEGCTTKDKCMSIVAALQKDHIENERLPDIKFNFLIGGDGKVYEGRGWNYQPSLPERYDNLNKRSIYIGFIGGIRGEMPPEYERQARDSIIRYGLNYKLLALKFSEFITNQL